MSLAERLKKTRMGKKISQQKLAELAGVHYTNIGRYERGNAKPSATVLNKIATALEISPDYLMNGTFNEKAKENIADQELLKHFKKIENMPEDRKKLLLEFLEAFIFKTEIQQKLS